jgi:hypothetical protein
MCTSQCIYQNACVAAETIDYLYSNLAVADIEGNDVNDVMPNLFYATFVESNVAFDLRSKSS